MVSFFDQFKGQKWIVDVRTALENARADFRQAWGRQRADTIAQVNAELAKFVDDKILNDQFIDREEEAVLKREAEQRGVRLEELPIYDTLKHYTNDYRAAAEFKEELDRRFLNKSITQDWINSQMLPPDDMQMP